jgi:hypothetical protein
MHYKKIEIKTQADLPKIGQRVLVHDVMSGIEWYEYKSRQKDYMLQRVDWYLVPDPSVELLQELCEAYRKLERNVTMQLVTPEPTTQEMADNRYQALKQESELRQKISELTERIKG